MGWKGIRGRARRREFGEWGTTGKLLQLTMEIGQKLRNEGWGMGISDEVWETVDSKLLISKAYCWEMQFLLIWHFFFSVFGKLFEMFILNPLSNFRSISAG